MRSIIITTLWFLLVSVLPGTAAPAPSAAELRTKALELLEPLPDKMPGAEKDTPPLIRLGEKLYFEKRISVNGKLSCNDCHKVDGDGPGVDNQPTSEGVHGKRGDRNSPTTLNAGFHFSQFWDGRAKDLEEQAKGPVLNPVEMAMPDETEVLRRLQADRDYPNLFKTAFPSQANPVTYDNFGRAIAAFERTLITRDRFDDFLKGDDRALSALELKGLSTFLDTGCTTCHVGPTLGGNMYQKMGLIHRYANTNDIGRFKVTQEEGDEFRFKVPSLRNVAMTWPYFHDGAVPDLATAIKTMAHLQLNKQLTQDELEALKAFLSSLNDKKRRASS